MSSANLNVYSGVLGGQYVTSLLDIACSIKEDAIDTSTYGIELEEPGLEQPRNELCILLATFDEMIRTCKAKRDNKERLVTVSYKQKQENKRNLQSTIANTAQGSPTPDASMFIRGIP
jgi:hypothetical protein